jgi:hypothetical protein
LREPNAVKDARRLFLRQCLRTIDHGLSISS